MDVLSEAAITMDLFLLHEPSLAWKPLFYFLIPVTRYAILS